MVNFGFLTAHTSGNSKLRGPPCKNWFCSLFWLYYLASHMRFVILNKPFFQNKTFFSCWNSNNSPTAVHKLPPQTNVKIYNNSKQNSVYCLQFRLTSNKKQGGYVKEPGCVFYMGQQKYLCTRTLVYSIKVYFCCLLQRLGKCAHVDESTEFICYEEFSKMRIVFFQSF